MVVDPLLLVDAVVWLVEPGLLVLAVVPAVLGLPLIGAWLLVLIPLVIALAMLLLGGSSVGLLESPILSWSC